MPSAMLLVIRAWALSDMHLLPDMKSSEGVEWPLSLNTERFFFPSQSHGFLLPSMSPVVPRKPLCRWETTSIQCEYTSDGRADWEGPRVRKQDRILKHLVATHSNS